VKEIALQTILSSNNSGFTLIEVMVAMVIMLVGLLGLLQSVNIATEHNLKNQLREEATRVAENTMNDMRTSTFTSVFNQFTTASSKIRNSSKEYFVRRTVTAMSTGSREYQVDVKWKYKNYSATHSIISVRGLQ
jgi:type IV pilus assembly protein PilV